MGAPRAALLLLAPALLAGCTWGPPPGPGDRDAAWWELGAWWEVEVRTPTGTQTVRHTVFANESGHFLVGVSDRARALDLALSAADPFVARVHAGTLAVHEGEAHAAMWRFPLTDGDTFQSHAFGHAWNLSVQQGRDGFHVVGVAADGATAEWSWDPGVRWFRHARVVDAKGAVELDAEVVVYGSGATGGFLLADAREMYHGPREQGVHEERFEVRPHDRELAALALDMDLNITGPTRLELVDPTGTVRHAESTPGSRIDRVEQVRDPPVGTWTLRFLGNATVEGTIRVVALTVYEGTL
ncbi:MAG TPA: hypothetical protein VI997_07410 [Candidatus Thermoplasmatota archaeon]|nr:hypothetical protein [Candidatus Thermoplasmatota archaeon]